MPRIVTATIPLLPPTAMYEDRATQLDFRLTKNITVGKTRMQGQFDVYNALNANPVIASIGTYGPRFLTPAAVLAARTFKFGVVINY